MMTVRASPRPDRVLIVRLDGIGDFILWLDAAEALAKHYRERGMRTILVANALWAGWALELGIFDEVVAVDVRKFQRSPLYRYRIGRRIRRLGCSTAIESTYSRYRLLGDAAIRLSGAGERIGSAGDTSNMDARQKQIADRWYTRLIPADPSPKMELIRNAEFIRNFCEPGFRARLPRLNSSKLLRADDAFLSATSGKPYYALFPGASWNGKQWPVSKFIEVAERLYRQTGWQGVVCGGPSDLELAETLCTQSTAPLLNWAGRTDLAQLAAVLSTARLLLTNDTAAVHIASACGVPTVCLVGGGHYGRFMPYEVEMVTGQPLPRAVFHAMPCFGCLWKCIYERTSGDPVVCIAKVDSGQVWRQVSEILQSVEQTTNSGGLGNGG
jgi:ADP-heptose:LPS heptosyltransferase